MYLHKIQSYYKEKGLFRTWPKNSEADTSRKVALQTFI